MNSTTDAPAVLRQHYLVVSLAKMVFTHRKHGIVFVREPISRTEAARYCLQPLILYAVMPARTTLRHLVFAPAEQPRSLSKILWAAWNEVEVLRGVPDVLLVSRHVAAACPTLAVHLERAGVTLRVADGRDKTFPAVSRTAQNNAMEIGWNLGSGDHPMRTVADLNAASDRHLAFDVSMRSWSYRGRAIAERTDAWLSLPRRAVPALAGEETPWNPGPWLYAWEANLPPPGLTERHFQQTDGLWWLFQNEAASNFDGVPAETSDWSPIDNLANKAKLIADVWPGKPPDLASALKMPLRNLRWALSERIPIEPALRRPLQQLLGIEYRDEYGEYEVTGPCVLVASGRKTIAAYDELSHGGDLDFSFEVIPVTKQADPSWRYLLFQACGALPCVIMFPRGDKLAPDDGRLFINVEDPKPVEDAFYRDVVNTAALACADPARNVSYMLAFARRNENVLEEFDSQW